MSNQPNPSTDDDVASDDQQDQNNVSSQSGTPVAAKEHEPASFDEEKKLLTEIVKRSDEIDEAAEHEVKSKIHEAKLAAPEPKVPEDLKEAGIKSPQEEASEVVTKGSTIELPITEEEFKKGSHTKVTGSVKEKVVIGISSLFALALWVGKLIKIAHKHAKKVVFRSSSAKASEDEKGGDKSV